MKAIDDLTAKTNQSILGANTGNIKTFIIQALEKGDVDSFSELWLTKLPAKVHDSDYERYKDMQDLEFTARAYLCVTAAKEEAGDDMWKTASQKFGVFMKRIKPTYSGETTNFILHESLTKLTPGLVRSDKVR